MDSGPRRQRGGVPALALGAWVPALVLRAGADLPRRGNPVAGSGLTMSSVSLPGKEIFLSNGPVIGGSTTPKQSNGGSTVTVAMSARRVKQIAPNDCHHS